MPFARTLALVAALAAPAVDGSSSCSAQTRSRAFEAQVLFDAGHKLSGCVVADFDPSHPGQEIAVVGDQSIYVVWDEGGTWKHHKIARAGGEMIQCAAGDADPSSPGDELLVFGMLEGGEDDGGSGAAYLLSVEVGKAAKLQPVVSDTALLHGGAIADVDPRHEGAELVLVGFSNRIRVAHRKGSRWSVETAADLPGAGKAVVATGDGVVVACTDGSLVQLAFDAGAGEWRTNVLDQAAAGQSRLGFADGRLIAAGDDGALALFDLGEGTSPERHRIHAETDKLRGAVLADLDPATPGLEAATAGYGEVLTVLRLVSTDPDRWIATPIFKDQGRFHHLAAGELDPARPGAELVSCGYSGRLVLIH